MVPNSPVKKRIIRWKNVVLMPCYVNIGAYIDEGSMIDTFARVGSCCQIGKIVISLLVWYRWCPGACSSITNNN